jgi:predicted O-methyltransferase YrrM
MPYKSYPSYLLKRANQIIQEEGPASFLKGSLRLATRFLKDVVYGAYFLIYMKGISSKDNVEELVNLTFSACRGLVRPLQIQSEILRLAELLKQSNPQCIVEIGTHNGGTLFMWTRIASADSHIISIDLPVGQFGGGYAPWRILFYKSFALENKKLYLIRADSHDEGTLRKTRQLLREREIDFLFIDGDHTYEGVKKDFEMYSPLVAENGIIAFHDIVDEGPESECEVSKYWSQLKPKYDHVEFKADGNQRWGGIGVLFKCSGTETQNNIRRPVR